MENLIKVYSPYIAVGFLWAHLYPEVSAIDLCIIALSYKIADLVSNHYKADSEFR